MMFGHLKAEDFTNIIEGGELKSKLRAHLQSCTECEHALMSAQSFRQEMTQAAATEAEIQEPDWSQFRTDVRNAMLSRSARRQAAAKHWFGLLLRPAMSWGLAIAFAAGLSAGLFIWNQHVSDPSVPSQIASVVTPPLPVPSRAIGVPAPQVANLPEASTTAIPEEVSVDPRTIDPEIVAWSGTSVFEDVARLSDAQSRKFQQLLEAATREVPPSQ